MKKIHKFCVQVAQTFNSTDMQLPALLQCQ